MAPHRLPAANLPLVLAAGPAAQPIPAVPLEPAARIVRVYPSLRTPKAEGLARIDAEPVQRGVAPFRRKSGFCKPAFRKLGTTVGHVLPTEHPEAKHLGRPKIRPKLPMKIASLGRHPRISIALLHPVVDLDPLRFHCRALHSHEPQRPGRRRLSQEPTLVPKRGSASRNRHDDRHAGARIISSIAVRHARIE